jgi:hypothetical protein
VLVGKTLDLSSLLTGNLSALLELRINYFLVLNVDKGAEEGNEGGNQGQAPKGNKLDEEVGDQGSEESLYEVVSKNLDMIGRVHPKLAIIRVSGITYSTCGIYVLGENYALRLDDKEVDELLDIIKQTLKRGFRNGKVLTRTELGGKATTKGHLSGDLSGCRGTKCQVKKLEAIADDVEVSSGEDE